MTTGTASLIAGAGALATALVNRFIVSRGEKSPRTVRAANGIRVTFGDQVLVVQPSARPEDVAKLIAALQALNTPDTTEAKK